MKTAISIPDRIFEEAEQAAQRLRMSRSELYTKAVERFVAAEGGSEITAKLDAIYEGENSSLASDLAALQATSMKSGPAW